MSAERNLSAFPAQRNPVPLKGCQGHPATATKTAASPREAPCKKLLQRGLAAESKQGRIQKLLCFPFWPNLRLLGGSRLQARDV